MLDTLMLRRANLKDAPALTHLTIRSKSYWGYSEDQISLWREELTITSQYLNTNTAYILESVQVVVGYYSFFSISDKIVKLDNLFIDPDYIGNGFGKKLMNDFMERMQGFNFKKVTLDADPNAEQFYAKLGFEKVGQLETSIEGRFMPIMDKEICSSDKS